MADFFQNWKIDSWYKVLTHIGGALLAVALFVDVKGITNVQLQLLAGGCFLIGLGEWKNYKVLVGFKPADFVSGAAIIQAPVREPDLTGVLLEVCGVLLCSMGVWSLLQTTLRAVL